MGSNYKSHLVNSILELFNKLQDVRKGKLDIDRTTEQGSYRVLSYIRIVEKGPERNFWMVRKFKPLIIVDTDLHRIWENENKEALYVDCGDKDLEKLVRNHFYGFCKKEDIKIIALTRKGYDPQEPKIFIDVH